MVLSLDALGCSELGDGETKSQEPNSGLPLGARTKVLEAACCVPRVHEQGAGVSGKRDSKPSTLMADALPQAAPATLPKGRLHDCASQHGTVVLQCSLLSISRWGSVNTPASASSCPLAVPGVS